MARPHLAGLVEDQWNRGLAAVLTRRGWRHHVVPHVGYGGDDFLRVLARVLLAPESGAPVTERDRLLRRGWRAFVTAEALEVEVTVTVAGRRHLVRTDRSGLVDVRISNPGLAPGWHEVTVQTASSEPRTARVLVVAADTSFGIVSDLDDTVIRTWLPRPLVAAWNTFVLPEGARRPVRGMSRLYRDLLADHPGAPTVYLSTGAWNAAPALGRFLARYGFPDGPLLMTDWGPTNTGWFRSGQQHKRDSLERLAADLPAIRWVLVGDDGQHDPAIYAEFAAAHPDRARAVAIRELGVGEQVLSHLTPVALPDGGTSSPRVPEVRGPDGAALHRELRGVL